MKIEKKKVKRILFITLTNIGDIILTTPIIGALDREFAGARIDVMTGPLGREVFMRHPRISRVIIYDKHLSFRGKWRLARKLRSMRYNLVVDLKNSLFPVLIGSRYRTGLACRAPKGVLHKKEFHLWKLKRLGIDTDGLPFSVHVEQKDKVYVDKLLENIPAGEGIVVMSPLAKSLIKRWQAAGFACLGDRLTDELHLSVVMVGDSGDREMISGIIGRMKSRAFNLAGLTTIPQLAHLLKRSRLLITNDSAPMHVGSAVGARVLAIFGPTDPRKYGPRGKWDTVIKKALPCSPCETARCRYGHECMKQISAAEVYRAAKEMLHQEKQGDK